MLGLPTGSSPEIIYKLLVQKFKNGDVSFRNVVTFNMVRPGPCPFPQRYKYFVFPITCRC